MASHALELTITQKHAAEELSRADLDLLADMARRKVYADAVDLERLAFLVHFGFAKTTYNTRQGLAWELTAAGRVVGGLHGVRSVA